jgi:hypothetical protein
MLAHQRTGGDSFGIPVSSWNSMVCCQVGNLHSAAGKERIAGDEQGTGAISLKARKSRINLAAGAGLEETDFQPCSAGSFLRLPQCGLGT